MSVENQMVKPNGYGIAEPKELKEISVCDGCDSPILEGEEMLDWGCVHLHDDSGCISRYVHRDAVRKVAGQ